MRILITAGPAREPIDPVRFLSNRSSGIMGYALALAARNAGHGVTVISGPVALDPLDGMSTVGVETAAEMFDAVSVAIGYADVAIFAAAVSDYRPVKAASEKIKKHGGSVTLELERTRDILGAARNEFDFRGLLVGFAAETENLVGNAKSKLVDKGCDLVVANDVSRGDIGFDSADNAAVFCYPGGTTLEMEKCPKTDLAKRIIAECERLVGGGGTGS